MKKFFCTKDVMTKVVRFVLENYKEKVPYLLMKDNLPGESYYILPNFSQYTEEKS